MRYIAVVFLLLALLQNLVADDAAAPSVSVPNSLSQCTPVPLDIQGGTPPYSVSILKADNPSGEALQQFTDVHQPTSLSWGSNLTAGTVITFQVVDSKGRSASSGQSSIAAPGNCNAAGDQKQGSGASASSTGAATAANSTLPPQVLAPSTASASGAANATADGDLQPSTTGSAAAKNATDLPSAPLTNASLADIPGRLSPANSSAAKAPAPAASPAPASSLPSKNNQTTTSTPANRHAAASSSPAPLLTSAASSFFVALVASSFL